MAETLALALLAFLRALLGELGQRFLTLVLILSFLFYLVGTSKLGVLLGAPELVEAWAAEVEIFRTSALATLKLW